LLHGYQEVALAIAMRSTSVHSTAAAYLMDA
jgi:hypothetical protein